MDELRRAVDLVELVGRHVNLRRQGRNFVGRCPFHPDRTPSFTVSPEKQLFYCFGCKAAGDVFTFVMRREGVGFGEAVALLAERAGFDPSRFLPGEERARAEKRKRLLLALERAASFYREELWSARGEVARRYLAERGVSEETAALFGLGYASDEERALLSALSPDFPPEVLREAGLAFFSAGRYWDRFRHRLIFPIRDGSGRVVGFGARTLRGEEPKYVNSPETELFRKRSVLYGLDLARGAVRASGLAVLVEGYMDVIACRQAGVENVCASLGTSLSPEQASLLSRQADAVVLAYDADTAGGEAVLRSFSLLRSQGCEVRVADLGEGDPDDVVRREGPEGLRRRLEEARPFLDFALERLTRDRDLSRPEEKRRLLHSFFPYLFAEESPVVREEALRAAARRLGLEEKTVWAETEYWESKERRKKGYNRKDSLKGKPLALPAGGRTVAEEKLVRLLLLYPELRPEASGEVSRIRDPDLRAIAETLAGGGWPEAPELSERASRLAMETEEEVGDPWRLWRTVRGRLEREDLEERLRSLKREIDSLLSEGKEVPPSLRQAFQETARSLRS